MEKNNYLDYCGMIWSVRELSSGGWAVCTKPREGEDQWQECVPPWRGSTWEELQKRLDYNANMGGFSPYSTEEIE